MTIRIKQHDTPLWLSLQPFGFQLFVRTTQVASTVVLSIEAYLGSLDPLITGN